MAARVPTGTALYVGFRGAEALPAPRAGREASEPTQRDSPSVQGVHKQRNKHLELGA